MPTPRNAGRIAASTRTRRLVAGPRRRGRVLGVFPTALYVDFGSPVSTDLLALETADGLRLPGAAILAATSRAEPLRALHSGEEAQVGEGRLDVGPHVFDVVRWWTPRRPRTVLTPYDGARLDAVSRQLPALPQEIGDRLSCLTMALEDEAADLHSAVADLLGLGAGLTPQGDDVLAGLLVTLSAAPGSRPLAGRLGDVVTSQAATRTTTLSAALLRDAADGFAVPSLVELVDALHEVDQTGRGTTHRTLADVVVALLSVGHTSGAALAHGAVTAAGLRAAMPERGRGVLT